MLGSVVNSTYTGTSLTHMGAYWQGATTADQTAFFDNVSLSAIPEPAAVGLFFLTGILALLRRL